ncbi:hypothetical protein TREMEDRAFT_61169 [Tremella mesenterica DSM 1558]|uniref:uncharacterized protein n=1 Tax=Tremella mesenterica (strain ATCC 24925 / CBS 8224 / DSM 1558 / NBRC 9311 / NRRL Y-6157 / RJB 2259-6 / UBC 559-6) TaxID=578456 RepID=UPI0003F4A162|nr:uncharacterized protein TREMEDRAFT_61169 [Tremella mesenterica DSM 1558]EIW70661.1 hypothetical protein TREMEDRAFT_61169 [Tremella mesenterica DSM 1558]
MAVPSEPTFAQFYAQQENGFTGRHSSEDSSASLLQYAVAPGRPIAPGEQGSFEEPGAIPRRGSNASLQSLHQQYHESRRQRAGSSASVTDLVRGINVNDPLGEAQGQNQAGPAYQNHRPNGGVPNTRLNLLDPTRQESLPFDPTSDSTLIATAPKGGPKQSPPIRVNGSGQAYQPIGDIMFRREDQQQEQQPQQLQTPFTPPLQQGQYGQWAQFQQQFQEPYDHDIQEGVPHGYQMFDSGPSDDYMYSQASSYPNQPPSPSEVWDQGYSGENQGDQGDVLENILMQEEDELNRINSDHHSRPTSPFEPSHNLQEQVQQAYQLQDHYRQSFTPDSAFHSSGSRSTSPFVPPTHSPSPAPSFPQSNSGSSFYNKPNSPPALIIPGQQHSPSPSLPPIVTQPQAQQGNHATVHNVLGTSAGAGGLAPPVNPALEHLTGMAGISPIAPNADGPQIYIQPSTPISGLKDGRGLFDAALRRAGGFGQHGQSSRQQNAGQGQGQQQGDHTFSVPPPQARSPSNEPGRANNNASPMPQHHEMPFPGEMNLGDNLRSMPFRQRAKSDSAMAAAGGAFDRQALLQMFDPSAEGGLDEQLSVEQWKDIELWRSALAPDPQPAQATLDPRHLPGQDHHMQQGHAEPFDADAFLQHLQQSHQLSQLQAQANRNRQGGLVLNTALPGWKPPLGAGGLSPTSLAFYQQLGIDPAPASQLGGTVSAPYDVTSFHNIPFPNQPPLPHTADPTQSRFLSAGPSNALSGRRRSFAEGSHPAAGVGTPGYGVQLSNPTPFANLDPRKVRGLSPSGHRRGAKSEDLGRGIAGSGWGMGAGVSTSDFLQSITAIDGTLLPPRGRAHSSSRHSSASSARSVSPAPSVSSQGSSRYSPRMGMPDNGYLHGGMMGLGGPIQVPDLPTGRSLRVARMKVTSVATEVASTSRRTNDGIFKCPIPGCGSTFTRHFNLKGHLRSHNDERPYKCLYDGCPKSIVGFARQHDCKRHMLLHEGLRPFECEGCGKKFARLDALTRHHKSEQGQECALTHPLPVNPDGSPMTESQYKAYKGISVAEHAQLSGLGHGPGPGGGGAGLIGGGSGYTSGLGEEEELGTGSGMEEYDQL